MFVTGFTLLSLAAGMVVFTVYAVMNGGWIVPFFLVPVAVLLLAAFVDLWRGEL